ncbi:MULTISPECIES: Sec-independent protein translocase subunit TatA [Streptomyces]|uniref:Sec-independent protein translocase protein TatA n=1 Tax=Streptomyces botrytidirepellens TaxID=2486417 RepID=A0A3M8W0Y7_9ACTN|nr:MULTISPECIES: Sec-independent protein translocase subunit TatA [Streptomyces]QLH20739.1 Sec-independent protein translocase subunit TatA [Streptomyces sp. Rer75]RNG23250.1 Sec-independent protein translocase subunit TatA [Streptomyces botrytidirepellens]
MFGKLGATEIILILIVVLLLFGAKKLPDMARSLGKSARILKSEAKAMKSEGKQDENAPADPPNPGQDQGAHRTIQAAPGDVSSSRPVAEPSDTTKR